MTVDVRTQLQATLGAAYTVERELGGGGMSRVFLATDTRLGRRVVVKVLSPDLMASVSADRFEREIRLAARLQHPHIVPLLSAGDVGGIPYYTMPFVEGASLRDRLAAGPLPQTEAQSILRDVARALAYAHRQGIVHRDIKPENVLLAEGVAMVADFGVARALSAATTLSGDVLTQVGMQIGTPAYMAPEQAAGDPDVDFRADLYAFGVMAYELLAGQHPFAGKRNMHALVAAHLTEQPKPLTTHASDVKASLSTIVMQCLGKDPAERPESASAIVRALDGAQTPNAASASTTPPATKAVPGIAVLPFTNMSGDPENEYFSDGITDDLIGALTPLKGLKVAARTSSFAFKGKSVELATIGATLGVRSVLQGSVRRAGNRVRVTVQLMNAIEGTQLWSERYDRNLDDIFAIQDEIVRGIVDQLKVTLGLEQTVAAQLVAPQTDDLEAYQLCLRGREAAYLRSPASLRRAIEYFRQALGRDPDYARAHIGLAEAHIGLGVYQYIPTIEANEVAMSALQAAERLRPDLALVHVLWGQLKLYLRPDWHEAGPHFERALAIDPNEPLAHAYLAFLNGMLGNLEASKAAALRAVSLDPLSVFIRAVSVMGYPVVGIPGADSAAALDAHETALAMDPNAVIHLWMSATRLADFGRHEEAVARMRRTVELTQRGPLIVGMYARALALAGRREEALALRAELRDRAQREYVGPAAMLMMVGLDLDDEAATAALLEANIEAMTGPTAIVTTVVRELTPLLGSPRLGPLVRRLSLWATRPAVTASSSAEPLT